MSTMRAARFYGVRDVRVEDVRIPIPKPGQVLVEVEWCGICGSDLHEYLAGPRGIPTAATPHPLTGDFLPVTLGHEFCGRVKSAPASSSLKVGQAVMVDPRLVCRSCHPCTSHSDQSCSQLGFLGYSGGGGGGFSEFVAVEERMVHPLPDNVGVETAAVIEPLTVAYHALKQSGIRDFSDVTALVVGGGPVGVAVIIVLRSQGVKSVILSEPTVRRRHDNRDLVDAVFNPVEEDVASRCRELTGGRGVDVVFDCAGSARALKASFDALRSQGVFVNLALWEAPLTLPFVQYLLKEIEVRASAVYNDQDYSEVMQLMAQGKFAGYERMISGRISLEDISQQGLDELVDNKDSHVKILVTPKLENLR